MLGETDILMEKNETSVQSWLHLPLVSGHLPSLIHHHHQLYLYIYLTT